MKIKYRRYCVYYLVKILILTLRYVPLKVGLCLASFLGNLGYHFLGKYRKIALDNLNEVYSKDRSLNESITKKMFVNLARNGAEWMAMLAMDRKALTGIVSEFVGHGEMDAEMAAGRGVLVLTFHFGNWEMLAAYLKCRGYKGAVIVRRLYFYKYDKFIARLRRHFNADVIYRDESPKKMLKRLKDGHVLGMLADQDIDSIEGVFVDFFGKEAYTPTAPVKLAMAAGCKIFPTFVIRKDDGTFKIRVEKAIAVDERPGSNKEEDVKFYTQAWTSVMEKYVREYPDQWVWIHRRWKTQRQ